MMPMTTVTDGAAPNAWLDDARRRIGPVAEIVAHLAVIGPGGRLGDGDTAGLVDRLAAACAACEVWLHTAPAPEGLLASAAELGAAAEVLRHAAWLLRSLPTDDPVRRAARMTTADVLLAQGGDHLERFHVLAAVDVSV